MSLVERVVRKWVVVCDNCGYEDMAVSGGGNRCAPRGWTELRSGRHACSGTCLWLIEKRRRAETSRRVVPVNPQRTGQSGELE
jgi:hypothetical protein